MMESNVSTGTKTSSGYVKCLVFVALFIIYSVANIHLLHQQGAGAAKVHQMEDRFHGILPSQSTTSRKGIGNITTRTPEPKSIPLPLLPGVVPSRQRAHDVATSSTSTMAARGSRKGGNNNETERDGSRPYFILHIGPPKTATTAIQCGFHNVSGFLASYDNYFYLGRTCYFKSQGTMENGETPIKPADLINLLGPRGVGDEQYFRELRLRFLRHQEQGHHLVFSSELLSSKSQAIYHPEIWQALLQGFHVKIVIGYRHYFDWYPSMYHQQHLGPKLSKWPHQGGRHHPPFADYLRDHLRKLQAQDHDRLTQTNTHLSLWSLVAWSKHFDDVSIFDLHQPGDTFTNFVCQALPSADNLCKRLTEDMTEQAEYARNESTVPTSTAIVRVSSDFHAERVVEEAYDRGLRSTRDAKSKKRLVQKVRWALERDGIVFGPNKSNPVYWNCLPAILEEEFRNASLTLMERLHMMTSTSREPSNEEKTLALKEHHALFEKSKMKGKFCDINPNEVLNTSRLVKQVFGL